MVLTPAQRAIWHEARTWTQSKDTGDWLEKLWLIERSLHPWQRDAYLDPAARWNALVGRGGGKTTLVRARLVKRSLTTPGAKCLYIAKTRAHAERLMWLPLKDLLNKLEIEYVANETKLTLRLNRNGSEIQVAGCDTAAAAEAFRGEPRHEVVIDETGSFSPKLLENLLDRVIIPRLGDFENSSLGLIGTPSHILAGIFYESTRPGSEQHRKYADRDKPEYADFVGWSFHRWTLAEGAEFIPAMARLWADALLEKKRKGWGDDHPTWRREYLAEWSSDTSEGMFRYQPHDEHGNEWNQWDPPRNAAGFAQLPKGPAYRYTYGMDLGHGDPFALEIFASSPSERVLRHVYEFEQTGMYARKIAELLLGGPLETPADIEEKHRQPTGVLRHTGWPDEIVADAQGNGALLDELSAVYGIHTTRLGAKDKADRFNDIEQFNGDLLDGVLKILKGSKLEEQLQVLQWEVNEYGELKEPKGMRNDCTDSARYARKRALHNFTEAAPQEQPAPGTPERAAKRIEQLEESDDGERDEWTGWLTDEPIDESFFGN